MRPSGVVPLPDGKGQIPFETIADIKLTTGPSMIRDENGLLAGYVYVDFDTSKVDVGSYVAQAKEAVKSVTDRIPAGYSLVAIAGCIGLALALQVVTATLIGAILPMLAVAASFDPAVVASPALTTIVDITGLLIYFGLAQALLGL